MSAKPWLIYVRVSSDEQAREGVSLEAQREACINYLKALGVTDYEVLVDDGWSAWAKGHMKRPGIQRILHAIRHETIAGVLVWAVDRFMRRPRNLAELVDLMKEHRVSFAAVSQHINTEGAFGEFTVGMIGLIANLESGRTSERIKMAKAHIRAKGGFSGGPPPPGTRVVGTPGDLKLEPDPATAPAVARAFRAYADGASLKDVARQLHREGATKKLKTPTNMAILLRNPELVRVGVIDRALHDEVCIAIGARWSGPKAAAKKTTQRKAGLASSPNGRTEREWPLHGLAFCGRCGSAYIGARAKGRKATHDYLRCGGRNRGTCEQSDLPAQAWEGAVIRHVVKAAQGEDWSKAWAAYAAKLIAGNAETVAKRDAAAKERGRLATQLERLLDLVAEGGGAGAMTRDRLATLEARIAELDRELARYAGTLLAVDLLEQRRRFMLEAIKLGATRLPGATPMQQNHILSGIVQRIIMRDEPGEIILELLVPGPGGGPGFESECRVVERSAHCSNQRPSLRQAVVITRIGQKYQVLDAEAEPDVPAFLGRLRAMGTAAARELGVTDRQVRRVLAGRVSQERLRGMAMERARG